MDTDALTLFKSIAYECLNQQPVQRPTMDQIVKELEEVLELQWRHADLEHSNSPNEGTSSNNLEIALRKIRQATNGFDKNCLIGSGGYAQVYRAELDFSNIQSLSSIEVRGEDEVPTIRKTVAIKKITNVSNEDAKRGFLTEIELLSSCKHPNIVSLLGFSREANEMILIYEYAFNGSLGDYLVSSDKITTILTWAQRIQICLDVAHGINYLHTDMEGKPRIIHRDIKSDNILLDENMRAKLADFGLSKSHPMIQQPSNFYTKNIAGTEFYLDPEYLATGKYKRESDIYSFGVVLFEMLSGRVAYDSVYTKENDLGLAPIARRRFNEGTLKELIDPKITEEDGRIFTFNRRPNEDSFNTFSKIAYQCLAETQVKRPTIEVVTKELEKALELQGEPVVLSRFLLSDIVLATENFAETYCIGLYTNGKVYKAELDQFDNNYSLATEGKDNVEQSKKRITVAIKHITSRKGREGKEEFFEEIEMRTIYKHPNIVYLLGFCDEDDEMILVYELVSERSLDDYLKSVDKMDTFTWTQRLHACLNIARAVNHLHSKMEQRIVRIDIRSANILLDKNQGAKFAYFVVSKLHPANQETELKVYEDPEDLTKGKESDIYSFGVVLFEMFCGRVAYDPVFIKENDKGLAPIACQCFDDGTIERIMDPELKNETDEDISTSNTRLDKTSLATFLKVAYQCLGKSNRRPTMGIVIEELEKTLNLQESQCFNGGTIESFGTFLNLGEPVERSTMGIVIEEPEIALNLQESQCFPETAGEDIFTSNKQSLDTFLNIVHQCLEMIGRICGASYE